MLRQKEWRSPYYWAAFEMQGEWNDILRSLRPLKVGHHVARSPGGND